MSEYICNKRTIALRNRQASSSIWTIILIGQHLDKRGAVMSVTEAVIIVVTTGMTPSKVNVSICNSA